MENKLTARCLIIGASHAGVHAAFALRKEGWQGDIVLYDQDPNLPYHRPPLSKKYLSEQQPIEKYALKPLKSYEKEQIQLCLGQKVTEIDRSHKQILLADGSQVSYEKLILAVGGEPFIPPIPGLVDAPYTYTLRHVEDATQIMARASQLQESKVLIIGGGFIGLELAASLSQMGHAVTLLEREGRILSRVTVPEVSSWYQQLHTNHGVKVLTHQEVVNIETKVSPYEVLTADETAYSADLVIIGVGIRVHARLAKEAGLAVGNGIVVDEYLQTSDPDIYAIGDCSWHPNAAYDEPMRLESVPNAVDQAKVAAANICGNATIFQTIPWFWSDQYDAKLQMVGIGEGATQIEIRREEKPDSFSVWFLKDSKLIAVHAINHPRAYVLGTKLIKSGTSMDTSKLVNPEVALKPDNIVLNH